MGCLRIIGQLTFAMKHLILVIALLSSLFCSAQRYYLRPAAADSFSTVLVNLLHAAQDDFRDHKGPFLHTTYLSERDHLLDFRLPGSVAAILRESNGTYNAYLEFRGFEDAEALREGVANLDERIRLALGDQLMFREDTAAYRSDYRSYYLADDWGYFGMNLEILAGRSTAEVYLLSPKKEDHRSGGFFILLKVTGGVPRYFRFVTPTDPADPVLASAIDSVVRLARSDFSEYKATGTGVGSGRADSLVLNDWRFQLSFRGSHHYALLRVPGGPGIFENLSVSLEAALGPSFVHHRYKRDGKDVYLYFQYKSTVMSPRIYLGWSEDGNDIELRIESPVSHPVKRSREH